MGIEFFGLFTIIVCDFKIDWNMKECFMFMGFEVLRMGEVINEF